MQPEEYWISRRGDVIGREDWSQAETTRQALTYATIAEEVISRGYKTVLDVGCNIGMVARFLHLRAYTGAYLGVDSNPYALEIARAHGLSVRHANLRTIGTLSSTHECVIVKDVIEHLESLEPLRAALRVATRALVLGLFLPLIDGPTKTQLMAAGYYQNRYGRQELLTLVNGEGFRLDKSVLTRESTGSLNEVHILVRL